ncbi:hypothetical protein SAMN02927937_02513 [Paenimyroides aquimaris]|uniref:DUF3997 domain-containing protein n=2 Tax=Paenimyroides marinum TaxID=1159016 RepID=A0A1H6MJZ9_9FLAO|nr:hypothetical protein SAMN02927937_02513 [Paenimyroides aquimaris]
MIIYFLLILTQSCIGIRTDDSINLGNNYRFIQDTPQTIIYHSNDNYEGIGVEIIPPMVLSYQFDDRYIIVKSQDIDETTGNIEGKSIRYWIIDKRLRANSVESLDSINFYRILDERNISLRFSDS